jgi:hypothetical protein
MRVRIRGAGDKSSGYLMEIRRMVESSKGKAAEDSRTPNLSERGRPFDFAGAPWSAAVLCRFWKMNDAMRVRIRRKIRKLPKESKELVAAEVTRIILGSKSRQMILVTSDATTLSWNAAAIHVAFPAVTGLTLLLS